MLNLLPDVPEVIDQLQRIENIMSELMKQVGFQLCMPLHAIAICLLQCWQTSMGLLITRLVMLWVKSGVTQLYRFCSERNLPKFI